MLARSPFKTAEELGCYTSTYKGLILVLEKMKKGEFVWTDQNTPITNGFNMARGWMPGRSVECGTVGCIAGWAMHLARSTGQEMEPSRTVQQLEDWYGLVMPEGYTDGHHTLEQAQVALESYLLTGKADWS
jgi:hypothetical protein